MRTKEEIQADITIQNRWLEIYDIMTISDSNARIEARELVTAKLDILNHEMGQYSKTTHS